MRDSPHRLLDLRQPGLLQAGLRQRGVGHLDLRHPLLWIAISLIVKSVIGGFLPLSPDEAYYWVWSHHLQLSFYDHPPFVSWLFLLGQMFEGVGEFVRLPGILLAHATVVCWWALLREHITEIQLRFFVGLLLLSPLTGWGALIVTPDTGLLFFWSLSLYLSLRVLKYQTLRSYCLFGLALGLGGVSKYQMILFIPCLVLALFLVKRWREIRLAGVIIAALSAFVMISPVLLWNYWNDWISFQFQFAHGLGKRDWNPSWPLSYLLTQIFLVFPIPLWFALRVAISKRFSPISQFLLPFAFFPVLFFFLSSFRGPVEANWPLVAYPSIYGLAVMQDQLRGLKITILVWSFAFAVIASEFLMPWFPFRHNGREIFEGPRLGKALRPLIKEDDVLYARTYQTASLISFYLKKRVYKLKGFNRKDFFDSLPASEPTTSEFVIVVKKNEDLPKQYGRYQVNERIGLDCCYELLRVKASSSEVKVE